MTTLPNGTIEAPNHSSTAGCDVAIPANPGRLSQTGLEVD